MNSTCRRIRRELHESDLERLEAPERAVVKAHLESCVGCRTVFQEMQTVGRLLAQWEPEPPSDDFGMRLRRAVLEAQPAPVSVWTRLTTALSPPQRWKVPVQMAQIATVAAVFVAVISQFQFVGDSPPAEPVVRDIEPLTAPAPAPTPVELVVADPNDALAVVEQVVASHGGRIVRRRTVGDALEVTYEVPAAEASSVFQRLGELGDLEMPEAGYQDGDGHTVIRLRSRSGAR